MIDTDAYRMAFDDRRTVMAAAKHLNAYRFSSLVGNRLHRNTDYRTIPKGTVAEWLLVGTATERAVPVEEILDAIRCATSSKVPRKPPR